jgi:hypothetical protein
MNGLNRKSGQVFGKENLPFFNFILGCPGKKNCDESKEKVRGKIMFMWSWHYSSDILSWKLFRNKNLDDSAKKTCHQIRNTK